MSDVIMTKATELDAITPEIWTDTWYPTLKENLVWMPSVAFDYQGDIQSLGDQVNIPLVPQFPDAVDLAEGARNNAAGITFSTTPLVVNHEIAQDFIITKRGLKQSLDAQDKLREHAMFSIMKKIDQIIFGDVAPSTESPDHVTSFDSGTTLALADWLEAKELLDTALVPDQGQRVAVLGVAQFNDIFNIAGFMSREFIPNSGGLSQGSVSTPILGFRTRFTTIVSNTCSFLDPVFMQVAVQESPAPEVFNLGVDGIRAFRVNMTALFGNKQVESKRVVQIA